MACVQRQRRASSPTPAAEPAADPAADPHPHGARTPVGSWWGSHDLPWQRRFVKRWRDAIEWSSVATTSDTPAPGPVRTCVGCRARAAANELLRVVAGSDAEGHPALVPDPDHRAPGRGAHVHPTPECWQLAVRRRAFPRALRSGQGLDTALVEAHIMAPLSAHAPPSESPHHRPETGAHSS
ncbi:YlxR family protein [Nocardioides zeicaulis]|uniref:YlxR family protein n=1 Tax=Nocardioides zeicaulis TaxID=1776857 RepID=A0ABV6DXE2_9ACTN